MNEENIRLWIRRLYFLAGLIILFVGIVIVVQALDDEKFWEAALALGVGSIPVWIVLNKSLSEK